MSIVILVVLVIILFVVRTAIANDSEKTGRNICPVCHSEMEMGMMSRYHCPRCGYKQGSGYR